MGDYKIVITDVLLQNFKNHRSTKLSLGRLNVLVGPNGAGKTSVLKAIHWVSRLNNRKYDQLFQGEINPEEIATRDQNSFRIQISRGRHFKPAADFRFSKEEDGLWHIPLLKPDKGFQDLSLRYQINPNDPTLVSFTQTYKHGNSIKYSNAEPISTFSTFNAQYLTLTISQITQPSYTETIPPQMKNDGSYIASMLAYLMTYEPEKFQKLLSLTKRIIPTVKGIRVRPARIQRQEKRTITIDDHQTSISDNREVIGHELVFDMLSGDTIPAHSVSEGTLMTLGILTALVNVDGPMVILLDDIEQGIHPWAQRMLMDVLKELLDERKNLQIILTTHSPYIVDEVEASDVWVFNTDDEGFVQSERLDRHPDAEWALQILTTGEFLSAEGEEWVGKNNGDKVATFNA